MIISRSHIFTTTHLFLSEAAASARALFQKEDGNTLVRSQRSWYLDAIVTTSSSRFASRVIGLRPKLQNFWLLTCIFIYLYIVRHIYAINWNNNNNNNKMSDIYLHQARFQHLLCAGSPGSERHNRFYQTPT